MTINVTNDKFIFFEQGIISLSFSYAGYLLEWFYCYTYNTHSRAHFQGYTMCAIVVMQLIISE